MNKYWLMGCLCFIDIVINDTFHMNQQIQPETKCVIDTQKCST